MDTHKIEAKISQKTRGDSLKVWVHESYLLSVRAQRLSRNMASDESNF